MVSRNFELLSRNFELLSRNFKIKKKIPALILFRIFVFFAKRKSAFERDSCYLARSFSVISEKHSVTGRVIALFIVGSPGPSLFRFKCLHGYGLCHDMFMCAKNTCRIVHLIG